MNLSIPARFYGGSLVSTTPGLDSPACSSRPQLSSITTDRSMPALNASREEYPGIKNALCWPHISREVRSTPSPSRP